MELSNSVPKSTNISTSYYLARRGFLFLPMVNVTCHFLLFFSLAAGSLKMFLSLPCRISNVMGPSSSASRTLSRGIGFTFLPTCSSYLETTSCSSCTVKACLILELELPADDISTTMVSSGWTSGPNLSLMAARRAAGTRLGKGLVREGKLFEVLRSLSMSVVPNVESVFRLSSKRSQLLERFDFTAWYGSSWTWWTVCVMSGRVGTWLSSSLVSERSAKRTQEVIEELKKFEKSFDFLRF